MNRRRSVSASPSAHLQKGLHASRLRRISSPTKQTTPARKASLSPKKQSRKSVHGPREDTSSRAASVKTARKSVKGGADGGLEINHQPTKPKPQPKRKSGSSKSLPEPPESEVEVEVDLLKVSKPKSRAAPSKSKPTKASASSNNIGELITHVLRSFSD